MKRFSSKIWMLAIACCILLGTNLVSSPAMAGSTPPPLDIDVCSSAGGFQPWEYTTRVVFCVTESLKTAARQLAIALSNYFNRIAAIMFMLAVAWLGVQMAGGERQMVQRGISLALRLGIVAYFYSNINPIFDAIFGMYDWVIQLVVGGYVPWVFIDELLGKLIGMGPSLVLAQGLMGIVGASLLSSSAGIFMFLAGFMAIFDFIFFLFNVVFIYLMSFTLIAFMLSFTPVFVPMLLFFYTERYFNKWWHIIMSAMLIPILMFALLSLFLTIFNQLIVDIFEILGFPCSNPQDFTTCTPPDYRAYWKLNQPKFSWVMPSDPSYSQEMQAITSATDLSTPAIQSNVNPLMRRGFDKNMLNSPGIDFGPNHVKIMEELMFAFISLWIFASLMKSFIGKIPNIADDISGALNRITTEPTQLERTTRRFISQDSQQLQTSSANISENLKETVSRARNMVTGSKVGKK